MTTLEDIFKIIEGKEWDWFGSDFAIKGNEVSRKAIIELKSLADLLANQSWCKAVWGEGWNFYKDRYENFVPDEFRGMEDCQFYSLQSFRFLQKGDLLKTINYIYKTMKK